MTLHFVARSSCQVLIGRLRHSDARAEVDGKRTPGQRLVLARCAPLPAFAVMRWFSRSCTCESSVLRPSTMCLVFKVQSAAYITTAVGTFLGQNGNQRFVWSSPGPMRAVNEMMQIEATTNAWNTLKPTVRYFWSRFSRLQAVTRGTPANRSRSDRRPVCLKLSSHKEPLRIRDINLTSRLRHDCRLLALCAVNDGETTFVSALRTTAAWSKTANEGTARSDSLAASFDKLLQVMDVCFYVWVLFLPLCLTEPAYLLLAGRKAFRKRGELTLATLTEYFILGALLLIAYSLRRPKP